MAIIKLKGTRILVTRPTHQASPLMEAIEQAGGIALHFPTIQIECVDNSLATEELLPHLDDYWLAIFTSPNAVDQGLPQMRRDRELPATLRLAAIGTATAQRLQALLGRVIDIVPHGRSNSEGLLTEPALQEVDGHKIVIVRGTGGRELLASTLRARGAQVDYLEVYRRTRPAPGLPWPGAVDVIIATSNETFGNLRAMVKPAQWEQLLSTPLVTISQRNARYARAMGCSAPIIVAENATPTALIRAVANSLAPPASPERNPVGRAL